MLGKAIRHATPPSLFDRQPLVLMLVERLAAMVMHGTLGNDCSAGSMRSCRRHGRYAGSADCHALLRLRHSLIRDTRHTRPPDLATCSRAAWVPLLYYHPYNIIECTTDSRVFVALYFLYVLIFRVAGGRVVRRAAQQH